MIQYNEILNRRQKLLASLPAHTAVMIPAASEKTRNRDVAYRFRQDSHFYYLTLCQEPDAILLLIKEQATTSSICFVHPRDPDYEQWMGERLGPERAMSYLATDEAYGLHELDEHMPALLSRVESVYYPFFQNQELEERLRGWIVQARRRGGRTGHRVCQLNDINPVLGELRLFKSPAEQALIQKACDISARAHKRAMQSCRPGTPEYELEAELSYVFKHAGALHTAYNSIVGSGTNACVLHYEHNNDTCQDGELVLIDAGAEYRCYASDITRTFPVNGHFDDRQRTIYELVLKTQQTIIEHIKPGVSWQTLQQTASRFLTEGLCDLGILQESPQQAWQQGLYRQFYPHQFGHWMGLDVHDVGAYQVQGEFRQLQPGMVFTVEPGLYLSAATDSPYQGIGVRIEDDVLVTEQGCQVLTSQVPKQIDEIEALMQESEYDPTL